MPGGNGGPSLWLRGIWNLVLLAVTAGWVGWYEIPWSGDLLGSPAIDLAAMGIAAVAAAWRGNSLPESLLWLVLSRRIHLEAKGELEAFQALMSISWGGWVLGLAWATTGQARLLLAGYHLGLTFDPGICRPIGLGMSIGHDAAALDLLLLSAAVGRFLASPWPAWRPLPAGVLGGGLVWLLATHAVRPGGEVTADLLATLASVSLFLLALGPGAAAAAAGGTPSPAVAAGPDPGTGGPAVPYAPGPDRLRQVLVLAGLPLVLAAQGLTFLGEGDLWVALQKRVFAGGLHANLLAAWSLAMLAFILQPGEWDLFPPSTRRLARVGGFLVYFLTLIASGGRAAILVFLVMVAVAARRRLPGLSPARAAVVVGAIIFLGLYKLWWTSLWGEVLHNERWFIWRAAVDLIQANPWTGWGLLAFGQLPQTLPPEMALIPYDWVYPHTHQLLLEVALTGGIPLLLLFLACLGLWAASPALTPTGLTLGAGFLALGFFDFVWFTPSLSALLLGVFLEALRDPAGVAPRPGPAAVGPRDPAAWARWVMVGLAALAGVGLLGIHQGPFLYRAALDRLQAGNPSWAGLLEKAVQARPGCLPLRLQRLLIRWGTGLPPTGDDLPELDGLVGGWPGYYLPRFLRGRVLMLLGQADRATGDLEESVRLEPRDLTGVRWGQLALAREWAGQDPASAAWEATRRGGWGAALVLDHPAVGASLSAALAGRWAVAVPDSIYAVGDLAEVGQQLSRRGLVLPARGLPAALEAGLPPHIRETWDLVALQQGALASGPAPALAAAFPDAEGWGMARLEWLLEAAARAGDRDLFARVYPLVQDRVARRSKEHEHLRSAFLSLRFLPPGLALDRLQGLLEADPGNPWLLERFGDALAAAGRPDEARGAWQEALGLCPQVRLEPVFADGPRPWALGPTGDQWTFAFERVLRRFDVEAPRYHRVAWEAFLARLGAKAGGGGPPGGAGGGGGNGP